MRTFDTGATRDDDAAKYDPEGFLHPSVVERFCEYMHRHRLQRDGSLRASDNWQKGIPRSVYLKSAFRHFMDWWKLHRAGMSDAGRKSQVELEETLCALLFNIQGYLFETLKSSSSSGSQSAGSVSPPPQQEGSDASSSSGPQTNMVASEEDILASWRK